MSQNWGLGSEPTGLNWTPGALSLLPSQRIARHTSHPGDGAEVSAAIGLCTIHWTRGGTNVLLGRRSRHGERQPYRPSLDPDGCLVRFVATII